MTMSPTCLPISERPMGEVVEMSPLLTSDSSDGDELVLELLVLGGVEDADGGAEGDPVMGDVGEVHQGELGHALLELAEARVDKLLALLGHVVLGVFAEVAERRSLLDLLRELVSKLMLEVPDLLF